MINGVVNLYKEKGYTSMDAIRVLSGILKERKVGHTGTLDPQAEGVLPVCLGKATKVAELIMGTDKTYIAKMKFGAETDTQDCWGQVVKEAAYTFDPAGFEAAVKSFEGGYNQVPPMYSALKHEGKKLYDLARRGVVIERESRFVRIDRIRILTADAEGASIEVACSKGTYIRSLCEDIGRKTGYLAHMTELVRTATGPYRIQDSLTLSQIEGMVQKGETGFLTDLSTLFKELPVIRVPAEEDILLRNGNYLTYPASVIASQSGQRPCEGDQVRMELSDGTLAGLYRISEIFPEGKRGIREEAVRVTAFKMFV